MKGKDQSRKPDAISYEQREQLIEKGRLLHSHAVFHTLSNFTGRIMDMVFHKHHPAEKSRLKYS